MVVDSAGNVGIGNSTPTFPLSFAPALGDKISLWSNSTNSYGFGIQSSQLQIYTDISTADIVFGYGSSAAFFETMRIKGNGLVGIGTAAPVASAKLEVASTSSGFLPPRMTSTQRDAISSAAEGLIIYNTTSKAVEFYNGTSWFGTTHYIGESYGGGIVFYVYENGQHGLIAATADQSTSIQWFNGSFTNTNAIRDGIEATSYNTEHIIANQGAGNYAAMVCAKYNGGGYGDWYLPSKYELNLLYLQRAVVGGFSTIGYWSSSEFVITNTWFQRFDNGIQDNTNKANFGRVRAVRAF